MDFSRISRTTLLGRALRAPLALIPNGTVVRIIQGPLAGRRWIVGSATHGAWLGTYEHAKQRLFARLIQPGMVVFDLGANVGFYSLIASLRTGQSGKVFALEPLPRNIDLLRSHLRHNGMRNVEVIEAAVSDSSGTAAFEAHDSPAIGRVGPSGGLLVRTVTLDEMTSSHGLPLPDVIKIDIEGGELRALEGSRRLLERRHPTVFLATHGPQIHKDCCAFLRRLDYTVTGVSGDAASDTDELLARFDG